LSLSNWKTGRGNQPEICAGVARNNHPKVLRPTSGREETGRSGAIDLKVRCSGLDDFKSSYYWLSGGLAGVSGEPAFLFVTLLLGINIGQPQAGECVINHIEEFLFLDEQSALNAAGFGSVLLA
jgi:hypothetical protein